MQAEEILTKARTSDELPEGWIVFPLLRNKVIAEYGRLAIRHFYGNFSFCSGSAYSHSQ